MLPPEGAKPGDRVTWEGYPGDPVEVNSKDSLALMQESHVCMMIMIVFPMLLRSQMKKMDKKKGWEAIMPDLVTDKDGNATYKGTSLWSVGGGVCTSSVQNGTIK